MWSGKRRWVATLLLTVCLSAAGCAGLFGSADTRPTATPAPVPQNEDRDRPRLDPGSRTQLDTPASADTEAYAALTPTCQRPPGLVIMIQVSALQQNSPATNAGIRAVWRFAAPANRDATGPYPAFVELIRTEFQPLLNATTVTYGPVSRTADRATRKVTVRTANDTVHAYQWILTKQSDEPYQGCWMTSSVFPVAHAAGTATSPGSAD